MSDEKRAAVSDEKRAARAEPAEGAPGRPDEMQLVLLVALVQFVNILDFMMVMPLGPYFADALHFPKSHVGYIGMAYTAAAGLSGLAGAFFLDRFDRRPALLVSMLGLSVATAVAPIANSPFALGTRRTIEPPVAAMLRLTGESAVGIALVQPRNPLTQQGSCCSRTPATAAPAARARRRSA